MTTRRPGQLGSQLVDQPQQCLAKRIAGFGPWGDALLLLAPRRGDALDADLLAIGRWERNSARAMTNRLLPSAVLESPPDAKDGYTACVSELTRRGITPW